MPRIKLEPLGIYLNVTDKEVLLRSLQRGKVDLLAVCKGEGTCGTCALQVFQGGSALSKMESLEQATLKSIRKDPSQYRLTCQTCVLGEGIVFYLDNRAAKKLTQIMDRLKDRLAPRNIYHPTTGELLVKEGGMITQSILEKLLSE